MVSEESRIFMMKNYAKMQKKRDTKIRQDMIDKFEKMIDNFDFNSQIDRACLKVQLELLKGKMERRTDGPKNKI